MKIQLIAAENIKNIRAKRGLSQEGLALDAKMSRAYIGEVERAEKNISIGRLEKIAKVLKVEVDLLLRKNGYLEVKGGG
jgi:transcriptional regulator with XRE-family HTH domain